MAPFSSQAAVGKRGGLPGFERTDTAITRSRIRFPIFFTREKTSRTIRVCK